MRYNKPRDNLFVVTRPRAWLCYTWLLTF